MAKTKQTTVRLLHNYRGVNTREELWREGEMKTVATDLADDLVQRGIAELTKEEIAREPAESSSN